MSRHFFFFILAFDLYGTAATYPILGWCDKNEVHIRVYSHNKTVTYPEKILAIAAVGSGKNSVKALPRFFEADYFEIRITSASDAGVTSENREIIFRPTSQALPLQESRLVIFKSDQKISAINIQGQVSYKEKGTANSWKYAYTVSLEGTHDILQHYVNDKCVNSIDYYEHVDYEMGGEEDVKATEQALCGQILTPEAVHP